MSRKRRKEYAESKRIKIIAAILQKREQVNSEKLHEDDALSEQDTKDKIDIQDRTNFASEESEIDGNMKGENVKNVATDDKIETADNCVQEKYKRKGGSRKRRRGDFASQERKDVVTVIGRKEDVKRRKIDIKDNIIDQEQNKVKLPEKIEEAADPCVEEEWQKKEVVENVRENMQNQNE